MTPSPRHIIPLRQCLIALCLLLSALVASAAKRALLIGISAYPKQQSAAMSWKPIHVTNDVTLLSGTLKEQRFRVDTLVDSQATASGIRDALGRLARESRRGDLVFIHFSGHGQPFEDFSGEEDDGWDEAIVPFDAQKLYIPSTYEGENHITDDELSGLVDAVRRKVGAKGYVYVVLDACHSGGASRYYCSYPASSEEFIRGTDVGFSPSGKEYIPRIDTRAFMRIPRAPRLSGVCYIEACRAYQTNTEIRNDGQYYGPLSFYLNSVLREITLGSDTSWLDTLRKRMNGDTRLVKQNMVVEK